MANPRLLGELAKLRDIDLVAQDTGSTIGELCLPANVVRHGEGDSEAKLRAAAPHLWRAHDRANQVSTDTLNDLCVTVGDLRSLKRTSRSK
jgi:hypothetical protein